MGAEHGAFAVAVSQGCALMIGVTAYIERGRAYGSKRMRSDDE